MTTVTTLRARFGAATGNPFSGGAWRIPVRYGAVAGVTAVFVSLIGMVEAFSRREVIETAVSMDQVLLLAITGTAGYLAASRFAARGIGKSVIAATLSGVIATLFLLALLVLGDRINLRQVLLNASPSLYLELTFGKGLGTGAGLLALQIIAGAVGSGLIALLPPAPRRALLIGLTVVAGMGILHDLMSLTFQNWGPLSVLDTWLYSSTGLKVRGASALFLIFGGWSLLWAMKGPQIRERSKTLPLARSAARPVALLAALVLLAALPQILGLFLSEVLVLVGLAALMALGLNIVVGMAGLLDLGYVAFFAIGAYTMAILTSSELAFFGFNFWAALPLAILAGVVTGVLLGVPVLRMRGDYLAIVTLGFGEIVRLLVLSDALRPWLGGAQGIGRIPRPEIGSFEFVSSQQVYYLVLGGCVFAAFISWRLKGSRLGRAWLAIREDEDVAAAMGINRVYFKLLAFAAGAAFAAMSGAIAASRLGIIYPHSFSLLISINVLAIVIIGGMGNIPGVVIGAFALVGLPEILREFGDFRWLVYGAALVGMMLFRPAGLWPEAIRKRELTARPAGVPETPSTSPSAGDTS